MSIAEYFESVKDRILADSFVIDFKILKYVDRSNNGHMRARVIFSDDSNLEFSEFVEQSAENEILLVTYSYHWSDKNDNLIRRWDNANHFPKLKNFPHHIHNGETDKITPGAPINILQFSMKSPKSLGSNFASDIVRQIRFPDWQSTEDSKREVGKDLKNSFLSVDSVTKTSETKPYASRMTAQGI